MNNKIEAALPLLIGFSMLWIVGAIVLSILSRRKRRRPIFPGAPRDSRFVEGFASGRSLRSWITSLGGAYGCLLVYLAGDRLVIVPMFPFNLAFLPSLWRLEHTIRRKAIVRVEEKRGLLGKRVIIQFRTDRDERFELRLRNPDRFIRALSTR